MFFDGRVVDGYNNGVKHTMTAGALTLSGRVWTAVIKPNPLAVQPVTVEVRQKTLFSFNVICSSGPHTTSDNNTGSQFAVSFSKNCGNIPAGDYYIRIWRANTDGREIEGDGTLRTP